nr:unnamed protein product [Callosobruchus analis]
MEHLISPQDYENFNKILTSMPPETLITRRANSIGQHQCTITKEELEEDNASASEYSDKWLTELEVDNFSSYGKESLESIKNEQLRNHLKNWACNFNITQRALKELIKIFNDRLQMYYQ